ncbi:hypothetical protein BS78_10G241100 [Paspalum vaginatum]|nr:hypothetical protein BS78_10G241100 [Paspalum vaginatum]
MPSGIATCTNAWIVGDIAGHCYRCKGCGKLGPLELIPFQLVGATSISLYCIVYSCTPQSHITWEKVGC